ncbi:hypothetical protein B5M09_005691 [Aphanomyces astaci]|uniref:Peptidase A1 domain-containing protein n=1 Tax=Aphanomyces astaci TaxID=112090 RepID=A0A3R7Y7H2_APHAT|nr:hypothetical protein B5M09_005691 [Aphanomyces astaci]
MWPVGLSALLGFVAYTLAFTVGGTPTKPSSSYQLLVDTGSSNVALATSTCCSNSRALGSLPVFSCAASLSCAATTEPATNISVKYIASSWTGHVVKDVLATPRLGAISDFEFVAIDSQQEFIKGGFSGILGIAFDALAQAKWYVVLVSDVAYNGTSLPLPCTAFNAPKAIVDTGTTNMVLPPAVYRPLMAMLRDATLQAIPDFPSTYFSDRSVCCEAYCDPADVNSTLMSLPSLTVSFALQGNVRDQVTITIPPAYYWRPISVHSAVGTTTCRMMGLSEGSSMILGNVFMDGLYTVHDRANGQIGFAVADNCENLAISMKTVFSSALPPSTSSWCDCLSAAELNDNLVTSKIPGQRACFIWYWWTYVFLVSIVVIIICCVILLWMWMTKRRRSQQRRAMHAAPPPSFLQHQLLDGEGPMTPKEAPPLSLSSECLSDDDLPAASHHHTDVESVRNLGIEASGLEERKSFALKIAQDLFNFMTSFSTSTNSSMMVVPTNLLDRWMERFESKYRRDPNFMMKNN